MIETTLDDGLLPSGPETVADLSKLPYAVTDQREESPETQPFRFFDLPQELRFMVYEELMDNTKNDLKYVQPRGSNSDGEDEGVGEHTEAEASSDRDDESGEDPDHDAGLKPSEDLHEEEDPGTGTGPGPGPDTAVNTDEISDTGEYSNKFADDDDEIPLLSTWVKIPKEALAKLGDVVFKFEARWNLPLINPFSGIARCTLEMPSLKSLLLYSEIEMWIIESAAEQDDKNLGFQWFVDGLFHEQHLLFEIEKEHNRKVETSVGGGLYSLSTR
ncbi:unnamed protein product [Aureobasidium pullulans]|nr:unnamed protein product [Aureobasidium pullulans]